MKSVVTANPFRCRMWSHHDRLEGYVTEWTCSTEIESFGRHGQLVPALGRPLRDDPAYGARRLFVARHLNKPLLVELRDLGDRDAIIAMDIENRHRKDISSYERGLSYARWLRADYFKSQDEIARALKVSSSHVSRLLKLARLPSIVVDAFASPADICETWGLELAEALEQPEHRAAMVRRARAIVATTPRPAGRDVYRQLMAASAPGRKPKRAVHDMIVKGQDGEPLFRVRQQTNTIAILLPVTRISEDMIGHIRRDITNIMQQPKERTGARTGTVSTEREGDRVS
jgi:ParB family transcriptional regulator, chromosome partitioning protein